MVISNSLVQQNASKMVEYTAGAETVKLSPNIIRNYLVNGEGKVSDQEIVMFLNLCRYQHLNPFLREAYLVKYGSIGHNTFNGCAALESVNIPSGITTVEYGMFDGCVSLKTIAIPENIKTIGNGAFGNTGLTSVTIPAYITVILRQFNKVAIYQGL